MLTLAIYPTLYANDLHRFCGSAYQSASTPQITADERFRFRLGLGLGLELGFGLGLVLGG